MQTIVRHALEESEDTSGVTSVHSLKVNCFQKCYTNILFYLHHFLYWNNLIYYQKLCYNLSREHIYDIDLVCWARVKSK